MDKLVNYSSEDEAMEDTNYKKTAERARITLGRGKGAGAGTNKRQTRNGARSASSSSSSASSASDSGSSSSSTGSGSDSSKSARRKTKRPSNGGQHKNESATKQHNKFESNSRSSDTKRDVDNRYKRESPRDARDYRDKRQYQDYGNGGQQQQRNEHKSYKRDYERERNYNRDRNNDRARERNNDFRNQQRRYDDNRNSNNASFQHRQRDRFNDRQRDFDDRAQQRNYRARNERSEHSERYDNSERRTDNYRRRHDNSPPAMRQNQHKRFEQRDEPQQHYSRSTQRANRSRSKSRSHSPHPRSQTRSRSHSRERKTVSNISNDKRKLTTHAVAEVATRTDPSTTSTPFTKLIAAKQQAAVAAANVAMANKSISPDAAIKTDTTAIQLPSYYNPSVVNPNKYAEQMQKRKLLWGAKKTEDTAAKWGNAQFSHDSDGKVASKFMRLMGIKGAATSTKAEESKAPPAAAPDVKNREAMFSSMEQQYEVARQATHTMRGVGLGFSSQSRPF